MEAWQIWAHLLQQETKMIKDRPWFDDHVTPVAFFLVAVLMVGVMVELCSPKEQAPTWHERYVAENCERCERQGDPCCVYIDAAP